MQQYTNLPIKKADPKEIMKTTNVNMAQFTTLVQELQAEVNALKAKIKSLETKNK